MAYWHFDFRTDSFGWSLIWGQLLNTALLAKKLGESSKARATKQGYKIKQGPRE